MLDLKIQKNIDSQRVLVTETNIYNKKQPTRYYSVPGESADGFISGRKSMDNVDKLSLVGYGILSVLIGVMGAKTFKKPVLKAIGGLVYGAGAFIGTLFVDKKIEEHAKTNLLNRTGAEDITNDTEKVAAILKDEKI